MNTKSYRIKGKVIEQSTRSGIAGLCVEAWDKDLIFDDLVGSTQTDVQGTFEIQFDESYFSELFLDRRPDLYFRIFYKGTMLHSTERDVLWNLDAGDTALTINLISGIMSLDKEARKRCDAGIRRLLLMDDDAILLTVLKDKQRLKRLQDKHRAAAKNFRANPSRLPQETQQQINFLPHPVFSATIIDVLRRFIQIRAIVDFAGNADDLRAMGITVRSCMHNIFTIIATKHQLATLAAQPATRRITTPRQLIAQREEALATAQIDTIQDIFTNRGAGSVVGMIDGPVDVMHEAIQNRDGSTRIKYMWVQDPQTGATGLSPADYFAPHFPGAGTNPFEAWNYGILYDEAAINDALALGSDSSDVYGTGTGQVAIDTTQLFHGTHTTGIAAGTHVGTRRGAAPEADIVSIVPRYRWYDEIDPEDADAFLEDLTLDAIQCTLALGQYMDRPTVVNLCLGHNLGPHNGNSLFDLALDELLYSWTGRSIVVAAGNSNYDGFRKELLTSGSTTSWELSSWEDKDGLFLDIWSRGIELSIKADVGSQTTDWLIADSSTPEFEGTLADGDNRFELEIFRDAEPISGMHNIRIFIRDFREDSPWTIHLQNEHSTTDSEVWSWVGVQAGLGTLEPNTPDEMSLNDSACARAIISVGATNKPVGSTAEESWNFTHDSTVYRPSGCGPTLDGRIKPDIVAVGENVSSAQHLTGNGYWLMSGTSQSTPVVSGAIALLLTERPDLHPDTIKALLIQNADTTELNLDPSHPELFDQTQRNRFGHGRLRLLPIFEHIVEPGEIDVLVRTADDDYGAEPYIGDCFCHAPEVQVQAAQMFDPDASNTTQVRWGQKHAIRVRVHNLSDTPAMGTEVKLYYTRPWTAPTQWTQCRSQPESGPSEALTLTLDIPRLGFQDFIFDASDSGSDRCWVPQEDEVLEVDRDWSDHFCLLVEVYHAESGDIPGYEDAAGDTVTPDTALDVWSRNIKGTNNVALRNLHIR